LIKPFTFTNSNAKIRRVSWEQIPLGSIILEWPIILNASIPELLDYAYCHCSITQCPISKVSIDGWHSVTIADPSLELEKVNVSTSLKQAKVIKDGLHQIQQFKSASKELWMNDSNVKDGLLGLAKYENSAFSLRKSWLKSISSVIRDDEKFGSSIWGPEGKQESLGTVLGQLLTGAIPDPYQYPAVLELGIDVSYSMFSNKKAHFAYRYSLELIAQLHRYFPISQFRVSLLSEKAYLTKELIIQRDGKDSLDSMLNRLSIKPAGTQFAPFFRQVSQRARESLISHQNTLVILITDGVCEDQASALRTAELFAKEGIDYLQLVLHMDEEYREIIRTPHANQSLDGFRIAEDLREDEEEYRLNDDELETKCYENLQRITDIAEAAQGNQLILTYYPLFKYLSIDVYEQYLGKLFTSSVC
jgi:hypothetical protein